MLARRGSLVVAVAVFAAAIGVVPNTASADEASALTEEAVEAIELVDDLLGDETAEVAVHSDSETAAATIANGTEVNVPADPSDGIEIDLAGGGAELSITPLDGALAQFESPEGTAVAAAEGDGYVTTAQPLSDGEFRLAVTINDSAASHQLTYDLDVGHDVTVVARVDGGFDFVDASGEIIGGLAEPWGIDANGNAVEVTYQFDGNHLTRTVGATAETAYPVVANFCIFGKNPNGSCRGSSTFKKVGRAAISGLTNCLGGAAASTLLVGTGVVTANVTARAVAGRLAVKVAGGPWGYFAIGATGCVANVIR